MKELDVRNSSPREIICKLWLKDSYGFILQYKRRYNLTKIDQISIEDGSIINRVHLKEFPGKWFYSFLFSEKFCTEADVIKNAGQRKALATFDENNIPNIILSNIIKMDLKQHKDTIKLLELGDALTIGRKNCDISLPQNNKFSCIHCYIGKIQNGKYILYDCSSNGTIIDL